MSDEIEFNEIRPKSITDKLREKWGWIRKDKRLLIGGSLLLLIVAVGATFVVLRLGNKTEGKVEDPSSHQITAPSTSPPSPTTPPEELKTEVSPLDGILVTKKQMEEMQKKRILGIIIDNHKDSRPQNGLEQADLVYEVLVEGGISRFLALYYRQSATKAGGVRSIRSYFLDWLGEFGDPIFMHIGGSGGPGVDPSINALDIIQRLSLKSVGIGLGGNFWRDSSLHPAPHNAYTSTDLLWKGAQEKLGWIGPFILDQWIFKDEEAFANRGTFTDLTFSWGSWGNNSYQVRWVYDQAANVYLREQGGAKQLDAETQKQLTAKNIVLQHETQILINDEKRHINYQTLGSGKALVFRDGRVIEGTWQKTDRTSRTKYFDSEGNEIKFNQGQTWIEVIPKESPVSYK